MSPSRLLWAGVFGRTADEVALRAAPGGVILFARNLLPDPATGPAQAKALVDGLQARWGADLPLAVAIDQEGGAVSRLRPWVGETPSFRRVWESGGAPACEAWGRLWGEGLALLGINVDFAPVADLFDGNPGTGMGDRCASTDPAEVAAAVGAFLHGLEAMGVRGCLKHFPGLGGTLLDSHQGLPELDDPGRIAANARAFQMLAHEDRLAMVAHLKTPATGGLPASLHRGSVAENPWGVTGRFLPDDLEMGGCADWSWTDRVRLSLEAGHEWLLVCQSEQGIRACLDAAETLPETLWQPAVARNQAMRANLPAAKAGPLNEGAWTDWIQRVKRASSEP